MYFCKNIKNITYERKLFIFLGGLLLFSGLFLTSCTNEDIEDVNYETSKYEKYNYNIKETPDSIDVSELFSDYKAITRSITETSSVNNNYSNFEFSSSYLLNVEGKDGNIYIIPAKGTDNEGDFLIGVGSDKAIAYQLYLKKTGTDEYTIYNENREPVFSASYEENDCLAIVTNVYGNDVPVIPVTRVRGGWFTAACSVAISAGCYGLSAIGAVPTAGGSIGLAVCSTVICLALC